MKVVDHLRGPVSANMEQAVRDDVTLERIQLRLGQGIIVHTRCALHSGRRLGALS